MLTFIYGVNDKFDAINEILSIESMRSTILVKICTKRLSITLP
jgi:hypothetical protein